VTAWASVADVIVPPVMDQAYVVAPAGPEAVFPVESAQTPPAGTPVMTGVSGAALIGTSIEVEALQLEPLVTVSDRVTFPEAPAV
jgi:hypothetical protein